MKEVRTSRRSPGQWSPVLFFAAGGLLLVQVFMIGLLRYNIASFSDLWIAPPAIAALAASLAGLITLYPQIWGHAPRTARAGTGFAITAGTLLCLAVLWIMGGTLLGGAPEPPMGVIAAFMIAFVLSLILTAAASLQSGGSMRRVGYLLLVPVISWGMILVVGAMTSMSEALLLDFYTNGLISIAFLAIGHILKPQRERYSQ